MPDIIRDRTWCLLRDDSGVEWDVMDVWSKRAAGGTVERYPGDERAVARIFRRTGPVYGSQNREVLEERRYVFTEGETRWLVASEFQRQLSTARSD